MIKFYFLKKALLIKVPIISAYQREWFMKASHGIFYNLRPGLRYKIGLSRNVTLMNFILCP